MYAFHLLFSIVLLVRQLNRYKAILFDVGGTIVNGVPSEEELLLENFRQLGLQVSYDQVLSAFCNADRWVLGQATRMHSDGHRFPVEKSGAGIELLIYKELCKICGYVGTTETYANYQRLVLSPRKWVLVDAAIQITLETLLENGYRLGVVSNWRAGLEEVLASVGLDMYFEIIVQSSRFGFEKPNPQILLHACKEMFVTPAQCMYVGDLPADILCARLAGMGATLIGNDANPLLDEYHIKADHMLQKASDLLSII